MCSKLIEDILVNVPYMSIPISKDSGECISNFMRWSEIYLYNKKVVGVKSSWSGIYFKFEDGTSELFYLGGRDIKAKMISKT